MGFKNVTLDDYYMQDYGLMLESKVIELPEIQTKYVSVPLRNGDLDLTTVLSDRVHYGNRNITLNMNSLATYQVTKMSQIANMLHGRKVNIIFDDDLYYYYVGRLDMSSFKEYRIGAEYKIKADCEPFKYTIQTSAEDWLWDPFDFEEGYINEFKDIEIDGTETITLIADEQPTYAVLTTDAQVTVTFDGTSVTCTAGSTTLYDFEFVAGENEITISGTATVTIAYRGGRL